MTDVRDEERAVREAYDRTPYPSGSHHHTNPAHIAAMAILNGIDPPPVATARVLELGCSDGGNLIPTAVEFPSATFTGIDLSPRQIEAGQRFARAAGATNIDLRVMSILDVDASLGTFDYIIAHGVFSWVAPNVQDKILAICSENLAPNGVAYVSYNTYPGWHQRRIVRDMLLYHTRNEEDPEQRMTKAFELVRLLADTSAGQTDAHSTVMRTAREHFEEHADQPSYVLHDYLEISNAPLYFHEFVARARAAGLEYVAEAEAGVTEAENLPPAIAAKLRENAGDRVELEQYVDFVVSRQFRRSLLTHAGAPIRRTATADRLRALHVASAVKPMGERPDLRADVTEGFKTDRGATFTTSHPLAKAAFVALAQVWPATLAFDDLVFDMAARLRSDVDDAAVADLIDSLHTTGVVELYATPVACTPHVSERPAVSPLVRLQAANGVLVTNQRHRVLKMDDSTARFLLTQLDGTRDRAALVRVMEKEVLAGHLNVSVDGKPVERNRLPTVLQALLEHNLKKMAEYALLIA